MRIRVLALAALAVVAALAAGCGGGGGDRLTKEDYIAKADAICKSANEKLDALPAPESLEDVASLADDAIAIQEDALSQLRDLKPPEADEARLNEAYDLLGQQVEIGRQIAQAAKDGDEAKVQELLGQIDPVNEQADQIAQDYGLAECGNN
jgi:hypothetical protein